MTYDSSDLYDLGAAIAFANQGRGYWRTVTRGRPTRDELVRHAERFGVEGVNEIAALYRVEMRKVKDEAKPARKRRTNEELRGQVLELHARGIIRAAIADTLNISDRRVAAILAAASA